MKEGESQWLQSWEGNLQRLSVSGIGASAALFGFGSLDSSFCISQSLGLISGLLA